MKETTVKNTTHHRHHQHCINDTIIIIIIIIYLLKINWTRRRTHDQQENKSRTRKAEKTGAYILPIKKTKKNKHTRYKNNYDYAYRKNAEKSTRFHIVLNVSWSTVTNNRVITTRRIMTRGALGLRMQWVWQTWQRSRWRLWRRVVGEQTRPSQPVSALSLNQPHTTATRFITRATLCKGGSVAEWLACWTQAQKGPGWNRSRDAVG